MKGILRFLYNHNTQCKKVTISSPIDDKIRFILSNPKTANIKLKPFMMGRVINLKKYLESLNIKRIYDSDYAYITDISRFHKVVGIFLKTYANKIE